MNSRIDKIGFLVLIITCISCIGFQFCNFSHSGYIKTKSDYSNCTKTELSMSPEIVPYFDSFIEDCKTHGLKYDHVYCLNWIMFGHSHSIQGQTDLYGGTIEINERLVEDSIGMKFVVYHEIGHWLGLEHSEGIMKETYNSNDTEYVRDNWNALLDDYFNKLKKEND